MIRAKPLALLAVAILGCDSASAPDDDLPESSFSYEAFGEVSGSHAGRGFVMPVAPAGFVSVNPQTGARTEFPVTPIVLADSSSLSAPQLYIGVLGDARVGTYGVVLGGTQAHFYADFSVPRAGDITRRFAITAGTLTITRVTSSGIAGHFAFESRVYFDWPRNAEPGSSVTGVPTTQSLTGSFVARRWGVTTIY